jgi:hypothetical protein
MARNPPKHIVIVCILESWFNFMQIIIRISFKLNTLHLDFWLFAPILILSFLRNSQCDWFDFFFLECNHFFLSLYFHFHKWSTKFDQGCYIYFFGSISTSFDPILCILRSIYFYTSFKNFSSKYLLLTIRYSA